MPEVVSVDLRTPPAVVAVSGRDRGPSSFSSLRRRGAGCPRQRGRATSVSRHDDSHPDGWSGHVFAASNGWARGTDCFVSPCLISGRGVFGGFAFFPSLGGDVFSPGGMCSQDDHASRRGRPQSAPTRSCSSAPFATASDCNKTDANGTPGALRASSEGEIRLDVVGSSVSNCSLDRYTCLNAPRGRSPVEPDPFISLCSRGGGAGAGVLSVPLTATPGRRLPRNSMPPFAEPCSARHEAGNSNRTGSREYFCFSSFSPISHSCSETRGRKGQAVTRQASHNRVRSSELCHFDASSSSLIDPKERGQSLLQREGSEVDRGRQAPLSHRDSNISCPPMGESRAPAQTPHQSREWQSEVRNALAPAPGSDGGFGGRRVSSDLGIRPTGAPGPIRIVLLRVVPPSVVRSPALAPPLLAAAQWFARSSVVAALVLPAPVFLPLPVVLGPLTSLWECSWPPTGLRELLGWPLRRRVTPKNLPTTMSLSVGEAGMSPSEAGGSGAASGGVQVAPSPFPAVRETRAPSLCSFRLRGVVVGLVSPVAPAFTLPLNVSAALM